MTNELVNTSSYNRKMHIIRKNNYKLLIKTKLLLLIVVVVIVRSFMVYIKLNKKFPGVTLRTNCN